MRKSASVRGRKILIFGILLSTASVCCAIIVLRLISLVFVVPRDQHPVISSSTNLKEIWCVSPGLIVTQMGLSADLVHLRTPNEIVSVRKANGETVWTFEIEDEASRVPPIIDGTSLIAISGSSGSVVILDSLSGREILSIPDQSSIRRIVTSIATNQTTVYVAWQNSGVVAYDINSGTKAWSVDFPQGRSYGSLVADDQGNVYVSEGSQIAAYNKDGHVLWAINTGGVIDALTQYRGTLYFYQDGFIKAVRIEDGTLKWKTPSDGRFPMRFDEGMIFVPGKGEMLVLSLESGQELQRISFDVSNSLQTPTIGQDNVYVESLHTGDIFVVDKMTGRQVGSIRIAAQITEPNLDFGISPQSDGAMLFVPSGSVLCAYRH